MTVGIPGHAATLVASDAAAPDLAAFCRAEHPRLVGMIGLYSGDADLAEELAQETLARVCAHWHRLPSPDDASRWATRVAFNLAKSRFRSRSTRHRILDRFGRSMTVEGVDTDTDTASALAVRAAVAALPDRQRRVIILRYFCDLPVHDVALAMSCAEGTVKSLTSLAIHALRRAGLEFADD